MIELRASDITSAEAGAWTRRYVWEWLDTALDADGTLLRIHDNLYANQHPDRTA